MGRFSQDCCENIFSTVRYVCPQTTTITFKCAIKMLSVSHYLKTSGGNYDEDERKYISIMDLLKQLKETKKNNVKYC